MSYNKMAAVYDLLMEDAPYDKWQVFTEGVFNIYQNKINEVVDLGCGTGQITCRLAKAGYNLVGIDLAADMLTHAAKRADEEQLKIQWVEQDLRELEIFDQFDAAISYCDVINYITTEAELLKVFNNTYQLLQSEGLFIFDVHALEYVESNLKDQIFSEMYEDMGYVWFCEAGDHPGEVFHDLTFFIQDQTQYERFDETHHQRTFPVATYQKLLEKSGFRILNLYADFSLEPIELEQTNNAERLFFVCQK
ncbi:putative methyltransferase YqeM [Paraliobacillus quinghaiensis]|uniref:Methyltransferase YqeM n=1 Tax=Paraliobacillus quinghaiensis TaxID=470815 RepID=A0A917WUH4_9BACI|nr:class I SAM-dependent methyltransferase [Paraliobacillus quinghaiensis]GGM31062.1 putative methyltransferase YqeM [Paraliobacillus quinghaiensis]